MSLESQFLDSNTFHDHWKAYKAHCYPTGLEPEQERQVYQAFLAGGVVVLNLIRKVANLPDDAQMNKMKELTEEMKDLSQIFVLGGANPMN